MDVGQLLLFLSVASSAMTLVRSLRPGGRGWAVAAALVLAVTGITYLLRPAAAGYVGGAVWLPALVLPSALQRRAARLRLQERYGAAWRAARLAAVLHPADGWPAQANVLYALALAARDDLPAADAALERVIARGGAVASVATAQREALHRRWGILARWVGATAAAHGSIQTRLLPFYLRALGECGKLQILADAFDQTRAALERSAPPTLSLCRLYLFAFAGRAREAALILDGPLADVPDATRAFWLATAALAAGGPGRGAAERSLRDLLPAADPLLRPVIEDRLASPPPEASTLARTPRALALLDEESRALREEERYEAGDATVRPVMTYALIVLNVTVFLAELWLGRGDATGLDTLVRLGALHPSFFGRTRHQWWRLVTANFLHAGVVHLGMNMLALYALGPFVEASLGRLRFLALYLLTGIAAMAAVLALQREGLLTPRPLVGASGAIMGLVGITASILLRGWAREHARAALRRLWLVVIVVAVQMVFDYLTPIVSSTAHVGGLCAGFILSSFVRHREGRGNDP